MKDEYVWALLLGTVPAQYFVIWLAVKAFDVKNGAVGIAVCITLGVMLVGFFAWVAFGHLVL